MRRVVITGIGLITSVGIGKNNFYNYLINDKINIKSFQIDNLTYSTSTENYVDKKTAKKLDKSQHLVIIAGIEALKDSNLKIKDPYRAGVAVGTTYGGIDFTIKEAKILFTKGPKRVSPYLSIAMFHTGCAGYLSIYLGTKGPCIAIPTGGTAGTDAIGYAFQLIQWNMVDIMLAGGAEAPFTHLSHNSLLDLGIISKAGICRPFSKNRDGLVLGEGAAVVVLEDIGHAMRRGAKIYAEVLGYGEGIELYHPFEHHSALSTPKAQSFLEVFKTSSISPDMVNYINANGDGTFLHDYLETLIIKKVFKEKAYNIPISSIKPFIGHTLAATGAIEVIASLLSIEKQVIFPTLNYNEKDIDCDLDYVPNRLRETEIDVVLSHSMEIGGRTSTILLKRMEV